MAEIGFIGAGNMGGPMLANLIKAGHAVTVFDLVQTALDAAQDAGATLAGSHGDAAAGRDAVITMLPAGGTDSAFARAETVLEPMAKTVVHAGPSGNGQTAKICNNMMLAASMIVTSEAFALADRLGLERQTMFDIVSSATGQCWALTSYCPVPGPVPASPANRDYQPGFTAAMMSKDLKLAQQAAESAGAATPIGAEAARRYAEFCDTGNDSLDFSAIFKLVDAGR